MQFRCVVPHMNELFEQVNTSGRRNSRPVSKPTNLDLTLEPLIHKVSSGRGYSTENGNSTRNFEPGFSSSRNVGGSGRST